MFEPHLNHTVQYANVAAFKGSLVRKENDIFSLLEKPQKTLSLFKNLIFLCISVASRDALNKTDDD